MICQYSVKNYKSIKEEITLNMDALNLSEYRNSLIKYDDKEKYLPIAAIYGPNGGGKSNLLSSLKLLCHKIVMPVNTVLGKLDNENIQINKFIPYKFNEKTAAAPTECDLFFRDGKYEFHYNAVIDGNDYLEEYLYRKKINGENYNRIFERNEKGIVFSNSLSKYNNKNVSKDISLISYLRLTNNKNKTINQIFTWFEYGVISFDITTQLDIFSESALIQMNKNDENHKTIVDMMKEMDIDISDYTVKEENGNNRVYIKHLVDDNENYLKLREESKGTIKLAGILSLILASLQMGSTIVIDELDCNLHPKLLGYIINLFSNPKINKLGSQLIFTSHDLVTMSKEYLRRDEIWFIAKNSEESSYLYSLAEFKKDNGKIPRKDETYSKQYLEGRYGSDPYLQKIISWK